MLLARAAWAGQSSAVLGTPEQFLRRTILFELWGKVLDSNLFASRAGALVSPRRPLGLPHAAEDGRVLDGGSGVPTVPVVCMSGTVLAVLPTLQQQQQHGEMAGMSVSLGTPTACFLSSSRQDVSCHGC